MEISHDFLVGRIVDYVESDDFKIFCPKNNQIIYQLEKRLPGMDLPDSISDYEGWRLDDSIYILGEAKTTSYNLKAKGSRTQLRNYLNKGKKRKNFHLIYAVPLSIFKHTKNVILEEIEKDEEISVSLHLITDTDYCAIKKI